MWEEVAALNREGTTVFLTTQYLEEADQLADRVGIIAKGRIVAEGTPAVLKAEVGRPHLEIGLARRVRRPRARGSARPSAASAREGRQAPVESPGRGGRGERSCGRSTRPGFAVASLDLVEPTLDDVFVDKTGEHLEGAEESRRPSPSGREPAAPSTCG